MPRRATAAKPLHPFLGVLGDRVRTLRTARSFTLATLADKAELSLRFVSDLEAGRANISVLNLIRLSAALGVAAPSLLDQGSGAPRLEVVSLLGLRGAGKSTVGRRLAERLKVPFFELDLLVEAEAGMGLSEIFAIHGEDFFRRQELAALKRFLMAHPRAVLAVGGGAVASPESFRLLLDSTHTVWLRASPEEHWQRVVAQGDLRPIENRPSAMAELRRRLREREPLYARAQMTCVTSGRTVDAIVAELERALGGAERRTTRVAPSVR